uniref:GNAT family N-acetyltransferase n=1 Tax=Ningiella ruwaisensis TaxID=2364274 RepID=UPI0010A0AE33|nr:GNAT family N-acetyltransferase [Ningiella ruwaisensis]
MFIELRKGRPEDAPHLAPLILSSAETLLAYVFGAKTEALDFLAKACAAKDGQYSAQRHVVATDAPAGKTQESDSSLVVACMSLWHSKMPKEFQQATLQSLTNFLNSQQLAHIIHANRLLEALFLPPLEHELCIGHLSVTAQYQGKDIASKLLAFALREAKHLGKTRLVLDVETSNEAAISFYQKWNFISLKEKKFTPTQQVFVRMQRSV